MPGNPISINERDFNSTLKTEQQKQKLSTKKIFPKFPRKCTETQKTAKQTITHKQQKTRTKTTKTTHRDGQKTLNRQQRR